MTVERSKRRFLIPRVFTTKSSCFTVVNCVKTFTPCTTESARWWVSQLVELKSHLTVLKRFSTHEYKYFVQDQSRFCLPKKIDLKFWHQQNDQLKLFCAQRELHGLNDKPCEQLVSPTLNERETISFPELRSPWPEVGKREHWEHHRQPKLSLWTTQGTIWRRIIRVCMGFSTRYPRKSLKVKLLIKNGLPYSIRVLFARIPKNRLNQVKSVKWQHHRVYACSLAS